jgi:hypothetical protein
MPHTSEYGDHIRLNIGVFECHFKDTANFLIFFSTLTIPKASLSIFGKEWRCHQLLWIETHFNSETENSLHIQNCNFPCIVLISDSQILLTSPIKRESSLEKESIPKEDRQWKLYIPGKRAKPCLLAPQGKANS